jgi:hypothetical protein
VQVATTNCTKCCHATPRFCYQGKFGNGFGATPRHFIIRKVLEVSVGLSFITTCISGRCGNRGQKAQQRLYSAGACRHPFSAQRRQEGAQRETCEGHCRTEYGRKCCRL